MDKSRYKQIADLKTVAKSVSFLQTNSINSIPELQQKIKDMHSKNSDNTEKIKKAERRLKTLTQHIQQAESYQDHKAVYRQYQQEKPKKQEAYYEAYSKEIILYESAEKYLKAHLNGHEKIPLGAWKTEASKHIAEKSSLYQQYYALKDEVMQVEIIRRCVEQVVGREGEPKRNLAKEAEL